MGGNNPLERIIREIRQRTRVVGSFLQNAVISDSGLRLLPIERALIQASPTFFERQDLAARICLSRADITELTRLLLDRASPWSPVASPARCEP